MKKICQSANRVMGQYANEAIWKLFNLKMQGL